MRFVGSDIDLPFVERFITGAHETSFIAYIHERGSTGDFGKEAKPKFKEVIEDNPNWFGSFRYVLAGIWGIPETQDRHIDFFGSGDPIPWSNKANYFSWASKNGIYVPCFSTESPFTHGDGQTILKMEEEHRRENTSRLSDYLINPPKIHKTTRV